jgi:hypothetical protein
MPRVVINAVPCRFRAIAEHGPQRIGGTRTAINSLYLLEGRALGKVVDHQVDPLLLARIGPDCHRLGRKHPIGKGHDERRAGFQHAPDRGEDLERMDEILHRNGQHRAVERRVVKR